MKTLISTLLLLVSSLSFADVAVYDGFEVTKTTSLSGTGTVTDRFIEVIDLANSQVVVITLGLDHHKKTFSTDPALAVVKTEVQDSRGRQRASTVLATGSTTVDGTTGITTVSSSLQVGGNLHVSIKTGETVDLPRNMQGSASLVATGTVDVPSELVEVKSTLVLRDALSRVSNDAGDTLAAAVDRLKAGLVAKGYVDADAP